MHYHPNTTPFQALAAAGYRLSRKHDVPMWYRISARGVHVMTLDASAAGGDMAIRARWAPEFWPFGIAAENPVDLARDLGHNPGSWQEAEDILAAAAPPECVFTVLPDGAVILGLSAPVEE